MRQEAKISDFFYKEPPVLSADCLEELALAGQSKESVKAMKLWDEKYSSEVKAHRETCLGNISNHAFMVSLLGTAKNDHAEKVLETYYMKYGFIRNGEVHGMPRQFICNHEKAMSLSEKKSFSEHETQPVYGGAYE